EARIFPIAILLLAKPQKIGRVDGDQHSRSIRTERQELAAGSLDRHRPSGKGTRGGRTERHDELRLDDLELSRNPPAANLDLAGVRALVKAALAALLELEMLHRIGDIDIRSFDSGFGERTIEDPACRPDEGTPGDIFRIAGLLAHEEEPRFRGAFAEHGLRRPFPQRAGTTVPGGVAHFRETCLVGCGSLRRIRGLAEELMLESHEWIDLMIRD